MKVRAFIYVLAAIGAAVHADEYSVTIDAANPRVARVEAELLPVRGEELLLSRDGADTGLYLGWATFLHEIEVRDAAGQQVDVEFAGSGRFRLARHVEGAVRVSYTMLLQHDRFPNQPGSDELAWARDDAVFWTGRAIFLEGEPAEGVDVRFELPAGWRATTPWQVVEPGTRFQARDTDALLDSGFIAGSQFEALLGAGTSESSADTRVRIALAGDNARGASEQIVATVERYLESFETLFGGSPENRLLLVAADGGFWGGGVMGTTISMMVGGELNEAMLPMLNFVTVHELFHLWNANFSYAGETGLESLYWMSEGTATYYALRSQLAQGDLPEEAVLDQLADEIGKYLAAAGHLSLVAAGPEKLDHYDLIYSGGLVASLALDMAIRTGSDDRFSLDDVMRALGSEGAVESLDVDSLADLIEGTTGVNVDALFNASIRGTERFALEDVLAKLGLAISISEGDSGAAVSLNHDPTTPEAATARWRSWPLHQ